jgi:predicted nuclease of predicted toxin-antitoxin system
LTFLVDAQLPPALARWIADRGHQARHVFDVDLQAASDAAVWEYARRENAVLVSKDEDFVDGWLLTEQSTSLIWIRKGNCSNRALMTWFERLWAETVSRLERGERFIELRASD